MEEEFDVVLKSEYHYLISHIRDDALIVQHRYTGSHVQVTFRLSLKRSVPPRIMAITILAIMIRVSV